MKKKLLIIILLLSMFIPLTAYAEDDEETTLSVFNDMITEVSKQYYYKSSDILYKENPYLNLSSNRVNWGAIHYTPESVSDRNMIYMNDISLIQSIYYEAFHYILIDNYDQVLTDNFINKYKNSEDHNLVAYYQDDEGVNSYGAQIALTISQPNPGEILVVRDENNNTYAILLFGNSTNRQYIGFENNQIVIGNASEISEFFLRLGTNSIGDDVDLITEVLIVNPYFAESSFSSKTVEQLKEDYPKTNYRIENKNMEIINYCTRSLYLTVDRSEKINCGIHVYNRGESGENNISTSPIVSTTNSTFTLQSGSTLHDLQPGSNHSFKYEVTVNDDVENDDTVQFVGLENEGSLLTLPTLEYRVAHSITDEEKEIIKEALSEEKSYDSDASFMSALYSESLGEEINYSDFYADKFIASVFERQNGTSYFVLTNDGNDLGDYIVFNEHGGVATRFNEMNWFSSAKVLSRTDFMVGDIVTIFTATSELRSYVYGGSTRGFVSRGYDGSLTTIETNEFINGLYENQVFTVHRPLMKSELEGTVSDPSDYNNPAEPTPDNPGGGADPSDPSDGDEPGTGTGGMGGVIITVPDTLMSGPILAGLFGTSCIGYGSYIIIKNKDKDEE